MRRRSGKQKEPAEQVVKDIRRNTRRQHSSEEKTRIVLEDLHGRDSIAELRRREGGVTSLYFSWSEDFVDVGKKRLAVDKARHRSAIQTPCK